MDWTMVAAIATSIYTLLFSIALWFAYVQTKGFEKSRKLQAVITIFNELYAETARKARKKIYKEVPVEIDGIEDEKLESYLEIVQDAVFMYHRIGYIIYEGHIDSDPIITTHWRTIWRCWKKSEKLIAWTQIKRGNPKYLEYFKYLFDLSENYRV
ncbi:MAG: hypothetical protein HY005_00770 [Candidatus Staskawiczbacteria bacterium]|nr:hypothetical protein [Candidatus Staskawiczbacteria bacterium]